jgi:hypothetical protein
MAGCFSGADPVALSSAVHALAAAMSAQMSDDELTLAAAMLTQLADTLNTIAVQRSLCSGEPGAESAEN